MQLWSSTTSPFVRKVRMTAIELGLDDRIEIVQAGPLGPGGDIARHNPLGKIPALRTDSGDILINSSVICAYLDGLAGGGKLLPVDVAERARVESLEALSDGITDAGVLRMMEGRRPEGDRSPAWVEKQTAVCRQGLDALENSADQWGDRVTVAQIAVCCLLAWIEFRPIEPDWRNNRPALADWYAGFSARPAALATEPSE